jgi:hypothetical protein
MTPAKPDNELPKRHELLLQHARAAFDEQHHRYEWGEVKISRYLTVLTVVIGLASVRLPELVGTVGRLGNAWEWGFVIAYSVTGAAAVVSLGFALAGLAYAPVPTLAIEPDIVTAITENPMDLVVPGLAERYIESARALRIVNAERFRHGERAYRWMGLALVGAVATTVLYVAVKVKGSQP